jgi:hypothetical protein
VFLDPAIAQKIALAAGRKYSSATAKDSRIFNNSNIVQGWAAAWRSIASQGEQLADVGQEQVGR